MSQPLLYLKSLCCYSYLCSFDEEPANDYSRFQLFVLQQGYLHQIYRNFFGDCTSQALVLKVLLKNLHLSLFQSYNIYSLKRRLIRYSWSPIEYFWCVRCRVWEISDFFSLITSFLFWKSKFWPHMFGCITDCLCGLF